MKKACSSPSREEVTTQLSRVPFLKHSDPLFWHGRCPGFTATAPPPCIWRSTKAPREDHEQDWWLTASEFEDDAEITSAKVRQLATLLRMSRKTVLYTGAGISASVVGQAARSGTNTVGWKAVDKRKVPPTFTHRALGYLGRVGLVHSWIQQNHDGLPQKAGFPQEHLNEIHGSRYDPSNPVVKYSGSLHSRCYDWMERDAEGADLVLVLGTSLSGLNADEVATNAGHRSLEGGCLGTVCLNLQQTPQDGLMSLRLFGRSDNLLRLLLRELGLSAAELSEVAKPSKPLWPAKSRVLVPYDAQGFRLPTTPDEGNEGNEDDDSGGGGRGGGGGDRGRSGKGSRQRWMWLDLRDRQRVRLTKGHNVQGAKQPAYMHIGAKRDVKLKSGAIRRACPEGKGTVLRRDESEAAFKVSIEGACMTLGIWWLDAALRGAVPQLPVVNCDPIYGFPGDSGDDDDGDGAAGGSSRTRKARGTTAANSTKPTSKSKKAGKRSKGWEEE